LLRLRKVGGQRGRGQCWQRGGGQWGGAPPTSPCPRHLLLWLVLVLSLMLVLVLKLVLL